MDIAEYSIAMNLQSVQRAVSVSVLSKAMSQETMGVQNVLESISEVNSGISQEPSFNIFDVRA